MDSFIVYTRFLTLCGLSESNGEKYRFLCDDAIGLLTSKAKSNCVISMHSGGFCMAAAALAALNYVTLYSSNNNVQSFKAGDVTIQLNAAADEQKLRAYYSECLKTIEPYLNDSDFSFKAV